MDVGRDVVCVVCVLCVFCQAEDGIRDLVRSRGLGDVYKRQRYDLPYDVGSRVYVQWAAENAQILID